MADVRNRLKAMLAFAFSFVTGCVDMICYSRFRTFPSMMTGNFVMMSITLGTSGFKTTEPDTDNILPEVPFYAIVILMYFLGVIVYRVVEERMPAWAGTILTPLVVLLIIGEECTLAFSGIPSRWCCFALAPVFGIQNSAVTRKGIGIPTAFVTGHMHTIGYACATNPCCRDVGSCRKIIVNVSTVLGLACGIITGGIALAMQKVPRECHLQLRCAAVMNLENVISTDMMCCPTLDGTFLDCCDMETYSLWFLLPAAPLIAVLLALHEWVFFEKPAIEAKPSESIASRDGSDTESLASRDGSPSSIGHRDSGISFAL